MRQYLANREIKSIRILIAVFLFIRVRVNVTNMLHADLKQQQLSNISLELNVVNNDNIGTRVNSTAGKRPDTPDRDKGGDELWFGLLIRVIVVVGIWYNF